MPYFVKGIFEISEDMLQILLEILFTQYSKVQDLLCDAPPDPQPNPFFNGYLYHLGFKPVQDYLQHDFAQMTDKDGSSVVLAEL